MILEAPAWRARRDRHRARVAGLLSGHRDRRIRGEPHPVEDFLFTYYTYRPAALRRWHPGAGVVLLDAAPGELGPGYRSVAGGATLAAEEMLARRGDAVGRIRTLLARTAARPGSFGCFGLHEWAMVYRIGRIRHAAWPIRLSPEDTAGVVDRAQLRCSHIDAYRFFTPAARPLNTLRPTRETQADLEQPGCLHANMDLYKWAYKLSPLIGSELVADCFELTRRIRELDMRASPYDLSRLGYAPVPVETPAGRAEYAAAQRAFAEQAAPLRARLIDAIDALPRPNA